jgi:hypothetical protein
MFRHPNYYKKLRASHVKKAISPNQSTDRGGRAPTIESCKQQAIEETVPHIDIQEAASDERQATSEGKLQATSSKRQASE